MLGRLLRELAGRVRRPDAASGPKGSAEDYALYVNGANEHRKNGDVERAGSLLKRAAALAPERYEAWYNLGTLLFEQWLLDESVEALQRALAAAGGDESRLGPIVMSLGLALQRSGEWQRARAFLEQAAREHPGLASDCLRVSLITWVAGADATPQASLDAHRRWAADYADPRQPEHLRHWNRDASRRPLRIGYVSGDFRSHPVSLFFEPVLEHHDRASFEVFCYDNSGAPDEVTERLRRYPAAWRTIAGVPDEECVRLMREDRIDILVDLSGHTARNRLDVFAQRPAPLQVTWLGYRTTTGMAAMDYRVTDAAVDPPGDPSPAYTEKLITLPGSQWCFSPREAAEPGPLPMLNTGQATFGSFNQFDKLNDRVLSAWSRLLNALPGSRLVVAGVPAGRCRERFLACWRDLGIERSRLEVHGYVSRDQFQSLHRKADIALDCFPCNGGTTTCESLWMGVPVVTLAGPWHVARAGSSLLAAAGLPDWIAGDEESYVGLALEKASAPEALSQLRGSLSARLRSSRLMDGLRFTGDLERGLIAAWATGRSERATAPA